MAESTPIRVGGVPEHFSLPFRLAFENGLITEKEMTFVEQPGGTGQMIKRLVEDELDVAIALSEGLVMASENGILRDCEIVTVFTESPLQWGIHVAPTSKAETVEDLDPKQTRIAVSRLLSGSHLMAFCFAKKYGWKEEDLTFVPVGGLKGALQAFRDDKVDLFLWDRFMTHPVCERGELRRIGQVDSPWPCFCVCARKAVVQQRKEELDRLLAVVLEQGRGFKEKKEEIVAILTKTYNLQESVAREWVECTEYAHPHPLQQTTIETIKRYIPPQ